MKNPIIYILFIGLLTIKAKAQTTHSGAPKPPIGKRWVLNNDFSDEFNGTELDTVKWLDTHPKWKGREPGLFLASQISVKNGFLQIKGEKMEKDSIIQTTKRQLKFNVAGGAVVSKKTTKFGYYEARIKAAATTMSSTFWFSTTKSYKGPNECDTYGLEWDIQECIGRSGDFNGSYFSNGMNSNGHFWYSDCKNKKHNLKGNSVKFTNTEVASKEFHVYGGWWKNENFSSLYYDNGFPKHLKFYDKILKKPFNQPMRMRLVSETYPFPWIPLPTDIELKDPTKNTVYYDWVRGYKLVDVNDKNIDQQQEISLNLYSESIFFPSSTIEIELKEDHKFSIPLSYKANQKRTIYVKILIPKDPLSSKNKKDIKVAEETIEVYPGYGNMEINFTIKNKYLRKSLDYKVEATIRATKHHSKTKTDLDISTLFINFKK